MSEDYHWWRADALCPEIGTEPFFPAELADAYLARSVCAICPVRLPCLTEALVLKDEYGIFGGFGKHSRRPLNRLVELGHNPIDVAREAIRKDRRHGGPDAADHRRGAEPGGHLRWLRPAAPRRAQERPGVAAQRPGAA